MMDNVEYISVDAPVDDAQLQAIRALDNNALVIRLHFTIHHLSRWITPIHDRNKLERARYHGELTPKQLLLAMRDHEQYVYPRLYVIANENDPNLDAIPEYVPSATVRMADEERSVVELLGYFRRLRQSTCGLLRELPDGAWTRKGYSRVHQNATLRQLAESLAIHDYQYLRAMDQTLWEVGAREGIADIQTWSLDKLLDLVPTSLDV